MRKSYNTYIIIADYSRCWVDGTNGIYKNYIQKHRVLNNKKFQKKGKEPLKKKDCRKYLPLGEFVS